MNGSRFGRVASGVAQKQLEALAQAAPGVVSAVLLSADGFEVASLQLGKDGAARLAAMGSALAAIGSAIAREAGIVDCRRLVVEADSGTIVVMNIASARPPLSLAIVAGEGCVLGSLLWSAQNCCTAIARAFAE